MTMKHSAIPPRHRAQRSPSRPTCRAAWALPLLLLACAAGSVSRLRAQPPLPEVPHPRVPIYGVPLDGFYIGGVSGTQLGNGPVDSLWAFGREMGIDYWELRDWPLDRVDSLLAAPHDRRQRLILKIAPIATAAHGREILLFPFDSALSYYWPNRFLVMNGGTPAFNAAEGGARETVYDAASGLRAGDTILKRIVYDYDPALQLRRYPERSGDNRVENSSGFILPKRGDTLYLVVTGHLFPDGPARHSDPVLALDIWNEIPKGGTWLDSSGTKRTAAVDTAMLYRTLYVWKEELEPFDTAADYRRYGSAAMPVNLDRYAGGAGGPLNDAVSAHGIDIRVRWLGEKIALRSIALRDALGELVLGDEPASESYRAALVSSAARMLHADRGSARSIASIDRTVVRFYSGDEYGLAENRAFNVVDSLLYTSFPTGDSSTRGIRAYHAQANHGHASQHQLTSAGEITVETYIGDVRYAYFDPRQWCGLPERLRQAPAIARHNGGRFHIPLLELDRAGVDLYTRAVQRLYVGAYNTGYDQWPYTTPPKWADELGHAAWSSRRTGKRIIQWPGVHSPLLLQWKHDDAGRRFVDTTMTHINEASEIRMAVNLGLCYGSRGVSYSWIGSATNEFEVTGESGGRWDGALHYDFYNDFGPVGSRVGIRGNRAPLFELKNADLVPPARFVIPDFYTGWDNRLNEMKWLSLDWLPRMGRAMARLRWRDGYSMHFAATQDYMSDNSGGLPQSRSRPFPDTLIVRAIESIDPRGTKDPPAETYVELGLFDPWSGTREGHPDPSRDTSHIVVVNRRTFERPADIDPASREGMTMDALAETRTLRIAFNRPAGSTPRTIRVREVEPDRTPLPGTSAPRAPLDVVIPDDGTVELTLRPGGAALLRITGE